MGLLEKDKRKFSVIIGSKKCGMCSGASPSLAAKKVKGKSGAFYLKEMTKCSKKKLYGPYSSKKKVVQRGGEENTLRQQICITVLEILKNCDKLRPVDEEMSNKYKILENAYLFLGINLRSDKCSVLKDIIRIRNLYHTKLGQEFPLCHCLCSSPDIQNPIEIGFCLKNGSYCKSKTKTDRNFYDKNWSNFISFLRRIIRQIELDTRLNLKKTDQELRGIRNRLDKEETKRFDNLRREIEESKAFHAAQNAQAGPAKEPTHSLTTNLSARLQKLLNNNKTNNLSARLQKLLNNNRTNNLSARLGALLNND